MDINSLISAFLGALFSFFISIPIENQRKLKLSISMENYSYDGNLIEKPAKAIKVLRVKIGNRKVKRAFSWWLKRETAIHCIATIQLLHIEDYSPLFTNPVHARWPRSDEPISPYITNENRIIMVFDPAKYNAVMSRNIYPGSEEPIDIVARYDNEEDCYIWNNDIYYKGWRNDEVKIPKGRYYVVVTVFASGEKTVGYFKLENNLHINNFHLHDMKEDEINRIKGKD